VRKIVKAVLLHFALQAYVIALYYYYYNSTSAGFFSLY